MKYEDLFNANPSSTFVWKHVEGEFILTDINKSALEISNGDASGFIGMKASEIYSDLPLMNEKLNECFSSRKSIEFEYHYKNRHQGTYDWIKFSLAFIDPEIILLYAYIINERKRALEELIISNNRYKESQLMGKVGNWEYDPVKDIFWGSEGAKLIYGFDPDSSEFSTDTVESCIEDPERVHQVLIDLIEQDKKYDIVFDILTYDKGIRKTIHSIAKVERDDEGNALKVSGTVHDITEIIQKENTLSKLQEKSRSYIEHSPIGIFLADEKGNYIDVNPKACALLGYSKNELLRLSIKDISVIKDKSFKKLKKDRSVRNEGKLRKKDGSIITVMLDAIALPDNQYIAFCTDITERINSEKELSEILIDLKLAQEIASIGNWQFDPDISIPVWSDEVYNIYERDKKLGPPLFDDYKKIYDREQYKIFSKAIRKAISEGVNYDIVLKYISPDNKVKWVRSICKPDTARKMKNGYFLRGTIQDITKQKETELLLEKAREEAEESEEKFSTIFNMSSSMICIADINTATFKFINPAFQKILGYKKDELLSKPFLEFVHPHDLKPTVDVIEKDLKEGKPRIYFVNRYKCKDGKYRHLAWNSYPLPEKGITYAIAHDISKQKEIEQELILAKEKAEESEKVIKHNLDKIQQLNNHFIGRELKMVELKQEVNELLIKTGLEKKYRIPRQSKPK